MMGKSSTCGQLMMTFMTLDKCLYLQALIGATISITLSKRYVFPLSMAQFLSAVIVTVVVR